jgi:hypothetical protein
LVIVDETTNIVCGCCPHPRAPGALALSLDRERDLGRTGRGAEGQGKARECGFNR